MPPISEQDQFPDVPLIEQGDLVIGGSETSGPNKALKPLTDRTFANSLRIQEILANSTNLVVGQDVQAWDELLDSISALGQPGLIRRVNGTTALAVSTWVNPAIANGRLCLVSDEPYADGNITSSNRIYYTPYDGNTIALRNGNEWQLTTFIESSVSLASLAANTNYDVFAFLNGNSLNLELQAWTNDTVRSQSLSRLNGVFVKTSDTSRRYLGSLRTVGAGVSANNEEQRYVFNVGNKLPHILRRKPVATSWNAVGTNWRAANGNTANRVQVLCGIRETAIDLQVLGTGSANARFGVSINTVGEASRDFGLGISDATQTTMIGSIYREIPRLGFSFYQLVEQSQDGTSGFSGDATALSGMWYC